MSDFIDISLVRIRGEDDCVVGAGFLVGERHVLTCAHVIVQALRLPSDANQPSSMVRLDFPRLTPDTRITAEVVFWVPSEGEGRGDIAGLKLLDKPPGGAEAVHFAQAGQVWGHSFCTLGFPDGFDDGVWATGRLLGRQGANLIQLEDIKVPGFAVISGFSGAPVWDTQLHGVVGMIVTTSREAAPKAAFAIPTDVLRSSWDMVPIPSVLRNPYKGLKAFNENDAHDFFGRETLIDELATAVKTALTREQKGAQSARLLAVLGSSGSGKSSVVMAGLIPYLRRGEVFDSKEWMYLDPIFPGAYPLKALADSLTKHVSAESSTSFYERLASAPESTLHLLVRQLVASSQRKVVLIVDQFEEVFTLTADEAERRCFVNLLVTAAKEPRGPLFVILTLRTDFYDQLMGYPDLYRLIDAHHVSVLPMGRDDLHKVIEEPTNLPDVKLTFEGGLVDKLLSEMQGRIGALPLLQFTLDQLFQRRDGHQLTMQAYREIGGVNGALSQYAEKIYEGLPSDEHRQTARDIFLRLIKPGLTEQDTTRRRAARSEFERADSAQTQRMETLEIFIRARLLTSNEGTDGIPTVEVSHEALIRKWKILEEWLRHARKDILLRQSLSEDAEEWKQRKRPKDGLYRGVKLKEAQKWARDNEPSELEMTFLRASAVQRTLTLMSIIVVVLSLVSSMGLAGWFASKQPRSPLLVTTTKDDIEGSLRWCIDNAPSGSTIKFAPDVSGTITLSGGGLAFAGDKWLTIAGPGANRLTISGGDRDAVIHVSKDATLNISDLSFKDNETVLSAFLFNEGTLMLTNSVISDNKTTSGGTSFKGGVGSGGISLGGGILNSSTGTLTVINSIISNNSASGDQDGQGGGIYNAGKLTVRHSKFSNNSASGSGNAVSDSNVTHGGVGGGIDNHGMLTVIESIFSNNSASGIDGSDGVGGAIFNHSVGTLTVTNSAFSGNSASGKQNGAGAGGGIFNDGTFTVTNSTFSHNSASGSGSGSGNSDVGGGIANTGTLTVTNSTFSTNSVSSSGSDGLGGAIYNYSASTLTVTSSTFSDNSASGKLYGQGGGVFNDGDLTVADSTFWKNEAIGTNSLGGGIFFSGLKDSSTTILFSTIYGNTSNIGGGIDIDPTSSSSMTISSSIVAANSSPNISGALISGGYNLIENLIGAERLANTDKQVKSSALKINPMLGNNGGPTQTLALLQGSPAIDAIPSEVCSITVTDVSGQDVVITTDQRGDPRPDGSENACDSGAYESSY